MKGLRLIKRALASAFLGTLLSMSAQAAEEGSVSSIAPFPGQWLERMVKATSKLTYRGHFVYQQGATLETFSVTHSVSGDKGEPVEFERVVYQDGLPREMVRQGKNIIFASANREPSVLQQSSLVPMVGRFSAGNSSQNYKFKASSIDRVAGREAIQLLVIPTDRFRHGYQLWLDRKTGLMLKSVMVDSEGRIMERMQFTDLDVVNSLSRAELALMNRPLPAKDKSSQVKLDVDQNFSSDDREWLAGWLPAGFEVRGQSRRTSPVSNQLVDTVNYSDGLASFSVFVEKDETRVLSQSAEQMGAMAAVSKVFRSGDVYYHVTVVGEIPLGTAERIAVSVRPKEKKGQ